MLCNHGLADDDLYAATESECKVIASAFNTAVTRVLGATDDGSARFGCAGYLNKEGYWGLYSRNCEVKTGLTGDGGRDTEDNALMFLSHMMDLPLESDLGRTISCHPTNGRYLYLDGDCDFLDTIQSWLKAVSEGQQPWLQPLPPNTAMVLVADVAGTTLANDAYWAEACTKIPSTAIGITVDMGAVRDFFKPIDGASYCEMLQAYNKHQWSATGEDDGWKIPSYGGAHNGGSSSNWPTNNGRKEGDERLKLSQWGPRHDASFTGGCCSSSYAISVTRPSLSGNGIHTDWGHAFTMSYLVAITTTTTTTTTKTTTTTTLAPAIPGDVCATSRDCTGTQCKNGRCCKADVDRACTSCDDAGFCDSFDKELLSNSGSETAGTADNSNSDNDANTDGSTSGGGLDTGTTIGIVVSVVIAAIGGVAMLLKSRKDAQNMDIIQKAIREQGTTQNRNPQYQEDEG